MCCIFFTGDCVNVNECEEGNPCGDNSECRDDSPGFTCSCLAGFAMSGENNCESKCSRIWYILFNATDELC